MKPTSSNMSGGLGDKSLQVRGRQNQILPEQNGVNRPKRFAMLREMLPPLFFFTAVIMAWEVAVRLFNIPFYLVPSPTEVVYVIARNLPLLVEDTVATFLEAVLGFLTAFGLAALFSLLFIRFPLLERSLMPFLVGFQAVPVVAMAPLLVLWFGNGVMGKVVLAATICFFPAVVNFSRGLRSASPEALTLMHSLSASPAQILFKLRLPCAVPFVLAAMRISATLSVIGAIVAEISGAKRGLGFRIVVSTYRTDTSMMFAALVFAVLLGLSFYGLTAGIDLLVRRLRPFTRTV